MTTSPPTCCLQHLNNLHLDRWLAAHHAIWWAVGLVVTVAVARVVLTRTKRRNRKPRGARGVVTAKLAAKLGYKDGTGLRCVETWPRDPQAVGAPIVLRYPTHRTPSPKDVTDYAEVIGGVVGGVWHGTNDGRSRLRYVRQAPPFTLPKWVDYADLALGKDLVPLGIRADGAQFNWDLTVEQYAHALLGGQSGSGKSNATRLIITGLVQAGAIVDVLDAKGGEDFEDFAALPSVRVWTEPMDMLAVVADFYIESIGRRPSRGTTRASLPRRVLLLDETAEIRTVMDTTGHLKDYVTTLLSIAATVRAVRMHLICSTQKPTGKALTGNPTTGAELRDLLGFKLGLGNLSDSAARMLFDTPSPPVDERDQGRGVVLEGGTFTMVQTAKLDLEEAVNIASQGVNKSVKIPEFTAVHAGSMAITGSVHAVPAAGAPPIVAAGVGMVCRRCARTWVTRSATVGKCPGCGYRQRVGVRA